MRLPDALKQNLESALADGDSDKEVISGANGLADRFEPGSNHNVSPETTHALYRSQFAYGRVDGTFASTTQELRDTVMGTETYAHAANTITAGTTIPTTRSQI